MRAPCTINIIIETHLIRHVPTMLQVQYHDHRTYQ